MATPAEEARERVIAALWNLWQTVQPDVDRSHVEAVVDDIEAYCSGSVMAELRAKGVVS